MNLQRLDCRQGPEPARVAPIQADSLAAVLGRCNHDEPSLVYMIPDESARRIESPPFFLSAIRAGQLYGKVCLTDNADSAAVWIRPEHGLTLRKMMPVPFSQAPEIAARYMKLGASIEQARKHLTRRPHWYLIILGAEPSRPPRAVREALIDPVLSQADSAGLPCYLETFDESWLPFYKDCGFRIAGAGRVCDGGPNFWAMIRTTESSRV